MTRYTSEEGFTEGLGHFNPWWGDASVLPPVGGFPRREGLYEDISFRVFDFELRRTVVLQGQRRAGKTVILHQLAHEAIADRGMDPLRFCYVDFGLSPDPSPAEAAIAFRKFRGKGPLLLLLDEVQSHPDWLREVKFITDHDRDMATVVTGSAISVSPEERARVALGRFSGCHIPPLLFSEFLKYTGQWPDGIPDSADFEGCASRRLGDRAISKLNKDFIDYLSFGAYPEIAFSGTRTQLEKKIFELREQVKDTVIGHGAQKAFGQHDTGMLRKVFRYLASVNGQETSVNSISSNCEGLKRNMVDRYIDALVSSFIVHRHTKLESMSARELLTSRNARYLVCNPSMTELLFGPIGRGDNAATGHMVEAATILQHDLYDSTSAEKRFFFARYKQNRETFEVDIIGNNSGLGDGFDFLCEIKWSDREREIKKGGRNVLMASRKYGGRLDKNARLFCTTKTIQGQEGPSGEVTLVPTALYCLGRGNEFIKSRLGFAKQD